MPNYDESGQKQPIEDIFHELTKRLLDINFFIKRQKDVSPMEEDIIENIRSQITAYNYDKALTTLKVNLDEIENLMKILKEDKGKFILKGRWADMPFVNNKAEELVEELVKYKSELSIIYEIIEEKKILYQQELTNINFPKIETNLTVEQIGGLLYFLLKHQEDLIITDAAKTCRIFSKVLATKKSSNLSEKYLYDMMLKTPKNKEITDFWKERFVSFYNNPITKKRKKDKS
jgi:hypothetical protein